MPVYQDDTTKTWFVKCYYTDYTGTKKQKKKRGFKLQRDAKEWERDFISKQAAQPNMTFKTLSDLYLEDKREHNKRITYETKKNRLEKWILPYFEQKSVDTITATDIRKWQADLKAAKNANNEPLSPGYMQNIVVELSSVFNFAVRFYGLTVNPCRIAGNTVGKKQKSLTFWTKSEFDQFIDTFDKADPYYTAFLVLYYTGVRIGELEALTAADIDLVANTLTISKTYHLIGGEGIVTPPKTEKANRSIVIPVFLAKRIEDYESHIYDIKPATRLFTASHSSYARQMELHTQVAGIKRIRLHDIRYPNSNKIQTFQKNYRDYNKYHLKRFGFYFGCMIPL